MKHTFYPNDWVDSTYLIDFEELANQDYRGVIFDVDNTLVPHGAPADERAIEFFAWLHTLGFETMLLSNNKEPRVKSFAEVTDAKYIYRANKPSAKGYQKAMEIMGTDVSNTIFVGDQLFTDIWGAKNANIRAVLVKPIKPFAEEIQIIIKRFIEAIFLLFYKSYRKHGKDIIKTPLLKEEFK